MKQSDLPVGAAVIYTRIRRWHGGPEHVLGIYLGIGILVTLFVLFFTILGGKAKIIDLIIATIFTPIFYPLVLIYLFRW